jgi:thiamine transport system permease protein
VVAALAVGALARKRRETALRLRSGSETARRPERGEWWVVAGGCAVLGLLLVPIIALVVKSVSTSDG